MKEVIATECEIWHGSIALYVLSGLPTIEEARLLAHLESCADCKIIANELAETCKLLGYVNLEAVMPTASMRTEPTDDMPDDLHEEDMRVRRRRWN